MTTSIPRPPRPDASEAVVADVVVVAGDVEYLHWLSECSSLSLKNRGKARQIAERLAKCYAYPPDAGEDVEKLSHNLAVYIDRSEDAGLETVLVPFGEASDICTLLQGTANAHPPAASAETERVAKLEQRLIQAVEAWGDGHDVNRVYNALQSAVMKALNNLLDAKAALGAQEVQS